MPDLQARSESEVCQEDARCAEALLPAQESAYDLTGSSMEAMRASISDPEVAERAIGAVLFARRPVTHDWITALFTMAEEAK